MEKLTLIHVYFEEGKMKVDLGKGNPAILCLGLKHAEMCVNDVLTQRTIEENTSAIVIPDKLMERLG